MVQYVFGVALTGFGSILALTQGDDPASIITAIGVAAAGIIVAVTGLVKVLRRMDQIETNVRAAAKTNADATQSNADRLDKLEGDGSA